MGQDNTDARGRTPDGRPHQRARQAGEPGQEQAGRLHPRIQVQPLDRRHRGEGQHDATHQDTTYSNLLRVAELKSKTATGPRLIMTQTTIHNPDRLMGDLRQILSQGRKRIGLLIGAGAPVSVRVNADGKVDPNGSPLIPDVGKLTKDVVDSLDSEELKVVNTLKSELGKTPNIEAILTRIRKLSQAIGGAKIHGFDGPSYEQLAKRICNKIGEIVAAPLPEEPNPFTELVSWIGGTPRNHPIEIFTPNYDLLLEEAFERARLPYFDGFSGAHKPFFDSTSISDEKLPQNWSRLWKIHGSLGWDVQGDAIIRTGSRTATNLIYPDHLKYDQIARQPYSALFERLRTFLTTPDSLLLCSGFSFSDAHITAVLDEALASNTHTAVIAFQFKSLAQETSAKHFALRRPNLSIYASDGGVIFGIEGEWQPGDLPNDEWISIRRTFWGDNGSGQLQFLLGDFAKLARFFALTRAEGFRPILNKTNTLGEISDSEKSTLPETVSENMVESDDA